MTFGLAWWVSLALLLTPPVMEGGATHYNAGTIMRNGHAPDWTAPTCAVAGPLYESLAGKTLLVCTKRKCAFCVVTDSGDGDAFQEYAVVLDLTPALFSVLRDRSAPDDNDGRLEVRVWVQ